MTEFKGLIIAGLLASLFIAALIGFSVQVGLDNGSNVSILNNTAISEIYSKVNESNKNASNVGSSQWSVLKGSDVDTTNELTLSSATKTALKLPEVAWTSFTNFFNLISIVLGIPSIVLYTITAILLVVIVVGIISLLKSGR